MFRRFIHLACESLSVEHHVLQVSVLLIMQLGFLNSTSRSLCSWGGLKAQTAIEEAVVEPLSVEQEYLTGVLTG